MLVTIHILQISCVYVADKFLADIESNYNGTSTDSFDAMNLKSYLLRGIHACNFKRPSAFQQHAIMPVIKSNDIIAQVQSGTGKTAAFCISILQIIDPNIKACQAIIFAPSRERAQEIQETIVSISNFTNIECYACFGGTHVKDEIEALQGRVPSVVIGTPGRVHDMIQRQVLYSDIRAIVLDEADKMLSYGFTEQIHDIFQMLSQGTRTQVVLFSATMPRDAMELTKFMRNPVRISVKKPGLFFKGIKHFYITVENEYEDWKLDSLLNLHDTITNRQTVIFCNKRKTLEWLTEKLTRDFEVAAIHGDMRADHRSIIMSDFFSSSYILLATDLLARGLNLQQVPLIINYDLPTNPENYINRIGHGSSRCKGVAINFVTADDMHIMKEIEQFYTTKIEKMPTNVAGKIMFPSSYNFAVTNPLSQAFSKCTTALFGPRYAHATRHYSVLGADDDRYACVRSLP